MLPPGSGFFAMWNGIAPELGESFALMHARDHLGEHLAYLGEDGILWARRHEDGRGTLPPNFVLYAMRSLDPLTAPAETAPKVHETELFKSIRQSFRDRIAYHCRVLASAGGGVGGAVGTFLVSLDPAATNRTAETDALMDGLTQLAPITAAHCGMVDWTKPIRAGGVLQTPGPSEEDLGVVIVESYDRFALAVAMNAIARRLAASGIVTAVRQSGHYAFSYGLAQADLAHLRHFRRDTRPDG